jgi:hypothetical protein
MDQRDIVVCLFVGWRKARLRRLLEGMIHLFLMRYMSRVISRMFLIRSIGNGGDTDRIIDMFMVRKAWRNDIVRYGNL